MADKIVQSRCSGTVGQEKQVFRQFREKQLSGHILQARIKQPLRLNDIKFLFKAVALSMPVVLPESAVTGV